MYTYIYIHSENPLYFVLRSTFNIRSTRVKPPVAYELSCMCLVGLCSPSSLTKQQVHTRKFCALRLKTRYVKCLCACASDMLSQPATVITAPHFHHFCFSLTFKNALTLSNTEPTPSNSSIRHTGCNAAGKFLALTQPFPCDKEHCTFRSAGRYL